METFVIPIAATINGDPNITIPSVLVNGTEDKKFDVGDIRVTLEGEEDVDKSEVYYIEVDRTGFGNDKRFDKIRFFVGSTEVKGQHRTILPDGWVRFPNVTGNPETILVKPPPHFSGTLDLSFRGTIVDYSNWNDAVKTTSSQSLSVNVIPVADNINYPPTSTTGVEDNGPVGFGQTLSAASCKDRATNNQVNKQGNNPEPEIISTVTLQFPADTSDVSYSVSYTDEGSASVAFDQASRTYTIASSLLTNVNLGLTESSVRVQAQPSHSRPSLQVPSLLQRLPMCP